MPRRSRRGTDTGTLVLGEQTDLNPTASWILLVGSSLGATFVLDRCRMPAALLLGPMLVAITFALRGTGIRLPRPLFTTAQGVVGCLIAHSVTGAVLLRVAGDWPDMAIAVAATVAISSAVGFVLARFGSLPGSAAAWGTSPGAAAAMTAMAEEYGADPRLVAFMQYVRVICVVLVASLVARWLRGGADMAGITGPLERAQEGIVGLVVTLAVAWGGAWLGSRLRVPSGGLMVPLVIGSVLNATGWVPLVLPWWLLAAAYMAIGLYIGLQFTQDTLRYTLRALPQVVAGCLATIALCALSAWLLVRLGRADPLTAFLATSPGGIDSVAIIAVGGHADVAFVMALQTLRLLVVLATGPIIAKLITRAADLRA